MKLLYLPIEIFDREFPSRLTVALEAISKGFAVLILEQNEFKANVNKFPPGAILHKDHNDCNAYHIFKNVKKLGFVTSSLDEEGLIYFNKRRYAHARIGKKCIKFTDIIFSWGPDQFSILKNNINNQNTAVICTGNPRFDLHIANREKRESYLIKKKILINTRFGSVNSGLRLDVDGYIERMRSVDEIKTEQDELFRRNYFVFMGQLFEKFMELTQCLATSLPDFDFTIRPHPSESSDPYINISKKYRNVNLSTSNSLEDDLLAHDLLIHNGCTTGIEALITGIPTFVYEPINAPEGDMALPNHFGKKFETIEGLISEISKDRQYDFTTDLAKMTNYISSLDSADAHKKIIDAINKKVNKTYSQNIINRIKIKPNYGRFIKNLILLVPDGLLNKSLLDKKLHWKFVSKKFPVINTKEIYRRIYDVMGYQKYISFSIKPEEIICKKMGAKGFMLYSNSQDLQ